MEYAVFDLGSAVLSNAEHDKILPRRGRHVMDVSVQDGGVEAERIFVRRREIATTAAGTRANLILDAH